MELNGMQMEGLGRSMYLVLWSFGENIMEVHFG